MNDRNPTLFNDLVTNDLSPKDPPVTREEVLREFRAAARDAVYAYLVDLGFDDKQDLVEAVAERVGSSASPQPEPEAKPKVRAKRTGPANACRAWTAAEDRKLRQLYPHSPTRYLAEEIFYRTPQALATRASELGIRKALREPRA